MKRSLTILVLFLFIGIESKAQKEVLFKIKYLPNHTYSSAMKMNMDMEMDFDGDTAVINKMKKGGPKLPMIMEMESGMNCNIKTGVVSFKSNFPLTMTIQALQSKMTMNGKETPMPGASQANQIMYGECTSDGKMSIDSIKGMKMNDTIKAAVIKMVNSIQADIKFPEKPMKIGDTFLQEIPMDIPIAGFAAKMLTKGTYKLTAIENNKAYFDIKFDLTMDMSGKKMNMDMSGDGDGKFVYDIATNYAVDMNSNMNMKYSVSMPQQPNMKMKGKMKMLMDVQTTIGAN